MCTLKNIYVFELKNICVFRFGKLIGSRPWTTILTSLVVCLVCSTGNIFFQSDTDVEKTWTPYGSESIVQKEWIAEHFPKDTRYETILINGNSQNLLTAETMNFVSAILLNLIEI